VGYLLSALLVGGTFIGTVTNAMPAVQRIARARKIRQVATMTVSYGIGQVAGPIVAHVMCPQSQFLRSLRATAASRAAAGLISLLAL
jgi:hypothetical protein